jgi:predicted membrane protein
MPAIAKPPGPLYISFVFSFYLSASIIYAHNCLNTDTKTMETIMITIIFTLAVGVVLGYFGKDQINSFMAKFKK